MTSQAGQFCHTALKAEAEIGVFWSDVIWYTTNLLCILVAVATLWNKDKIRQLYNTRFWETLVVAAIVSQCNGGLFIASVELSVRIILLTFLAFAVGF
jgi:hypothetical protein